jgi:hypothetical protein
MFRGKCLRLRAEPAHFSRHLPYETLQEARPKPHVLDDYTVNRAISAFTTQIADLWLFDEQLSRWQAETLPPEQRAEVARLVEQMRRLREVDHQVLALARELSKGTIEKVMAKSDEQLLDFLQFHQQGIYVSEQGRGLPPWAIDETGYVAGSVERQAPQLEEGTET